MAIIHVPYHVWVKDYHWTARKVRVQSPVLSLKRSASPPVFRPQEGNNKNEPRVASTADELCDDIRERQYLTEAHGILVANEPGQQHVPLWVTYQPTNSKGQDGEVSFVDLTSNTSRSGPIARICWVPHHRSSGGKLYTIVGGTRVWRKGKERVENTRVCVQEEGRPEKATLVQLTSDELSNLQPMGDMEKRRLFDLHLNIIIRNKQPLSETKRIVLKLAMSRNSLGNGWPALNSILEQDSDAHLPCWTNGSNHNDPLEMDEAYDDDNSEQEEASSDDRVVRAESNNMCRKCNYPGLNPTYLNRYPEHYHLEDRDCPVEHLHKNHCIKAAHAPSKCVIPSHDHCDSQLHDQEARMNIDSSPGSFEVPNWLIDIDMSVPCTPCSSPDSSARSEAMLPDLDPAEMAFDSLPDYEPMVTGSHIRASPGLPEPVF